MDPYYFNEFFLKVRRKEKLNQTNFARRLGVSRQAVSGIELLKQRISYDLLERFCQEFGYRLYFQSFKEDLEKRPVRELPPLPKVYKPKKKIRLKVL